jgi:hypothetical protein
VLVGVFAAEPLNEITIVEIKTYKRDRHTPCPIMGKTFFNSGGLTKLAKWLEGNRNSESCIRNEDRHLVR